MPRFELGVDLLAVRRLTHLVERDWFTSRVFGPDELAHAATLGSRRRLNHLAGRFVAKEALAKATGLGLLDLNPVHAQVVSDPTGRPVFRLDNVLKAKLEDEGVQKMSLSISHDAGFVIACVAVTYA